MTLRALWIGGLCLLATSCRSDPETRAEIDPADLEFLEEQIVAIDELGDGITAIRLGLSARSFVIHPELSPNPEQLLELAKDAQKAGGTVHATVLVLDHSPKGAPPVEGEPKWPFIILRLAATPDPRAAR